MPPAVLVIDPESGRRRALARGLAGMGYEVIPAIDLREARLYLAELGPGVVVAPAGLLEGELGLFTTAADGGPARRTMLLFGASEEEGRELPEGVAFLAVRDLSGEALVERVHLVLLGHEVGVEPDAEVASLVGDYSLVPPLELLRRLSGRRIGVQVVHDAGEVRMAGGEVVGATAGKAEGIKAFCRLSHLDAGPFRVLVAAPSPESAAGRLPEPLGQDFKSLVFRALEDHVHGAPGPRTGVRLEIGPVFFETRFSEWEREMLAAIPAAGTIGRLLDALPATDGEILRGLLHLRELGVVLFEEPEAAVAVVTDSTADLPSDLARAHGIHVVPVLVLFGERIYHDGVDLRPREFYERLAEGKVHPRTSPPLKGDFLEVYKALAPRQDVVSLHISRKMSETGGNARAAAEEEGAALRGLRQEVERPFAVEVVDSGSVSLGLGMLALFAARMAQRGLAAEAIALRLAAMRERMHILFVVETLSYLARGGRIGRARAAVGNLLGIKPILGVVDGEVAQVDRVRGGRAAHPRLIELFGERVDAGQPVVAGIAHAKAPVWADRLRSLIEKSFRVGELLVAEMGPVVGTHAGPGAVGAAMFQPTAEELPLIAPLGGGQEPEGRHG
ncbi:MAG: DegV family EDD domain-containing protein [Acidobacteriota bacterium]|nr:DegV family EDD domain-containing protein [Acidobacteriota bacterium]